MDAAAAVAVGKDEAFAWPATQVKTQNSTSLPSLPSIWSYMSISQLDVWKNMKLHTLKKMILNQAHENDTQENIVLLDVRICEVWCDSNSAHHFMMEFDPLNSMPWAGWTTGETCVFRLRPGATKATAMLRGRDLLRDVRKVRLRQTTNVQKMRRVMIHCTQEHSQVKPPFMHFTFVVYSTSMFSPSLGTVIRGTLATAVVVI